MGKAESEITFLTINCSKVRHDLPLPYSPCITDVPRRPSHYANYTHCLVTRGESESFQLAIIARYYFNEAKNQLLRHPLGHRKQQDSSPCTLTVQLLAEMISCRAKIILVANNPVLYEIILRVLVLLIGLLSLEKVLSVEFNSE